MNPDNSAVELFEFKFSVIFKAWKSQINDVTINKKLKSCMKSNKVYTCVRSSDYQQEVKVLYEE